MARASMRAGGCWCFEPIVYTIYFHTWPCYFSDGMGIYDYRKGKHSDNETEETKLTKKKIAEIIA